jgi:hypothetical protein
VAYRLARVCADERCRALRSLTYGQAAQFPALIDEVRTRTSDRLTDALADRLARLSLAGLLRQSDPALAAEQFLALLTGPLEARSRAGGQAVSAANTRGVANAAVDTFLRAYRPE